MEKFKITFLPDNKSVEAEKDTSILSAALSAGVYINSACAGEGVCGKCKVRVKSGKVATQHSGTISAEEKKEHMYLACLTTAQSDLEVEVLPQSRIDFSLQGISAEEIEAKQSVAGQNSFKYSPLTSKVYVELLRPDLNDRSSDLERLFREIRRNKSAGILQTSLVNIRLLGGLLRDADWKVTVTLGNKDGVTEVLLVEPGDSSSLNFGFAFDIGTTTVSGQLVDLNSGKTYGTKAVYNKQACFGSDVITRIIHAQKENGLDELHMAVIDSINGIIRELIIEHNIDLNNVSCILCAGNTTMMHLLFSIDPSYIRREPYTPTANFLPVVRAQEAGIRINPRGLLQAVPGVASYVGGDTSAGVLSSGLYEEEGLSILIDIGTNGEIVLGNKEFLVAAAASAGPAFEGSGVKCGMRSSSGAIQKVKITKAGEVTYSTIAGAKPAGICGSGYIDTIAQLLAAGYIDKNGKLIKEDNKRVRSGEEGREFVIAYQSETQLSNDIVITEADIENLKRSKAAIYSAAAVLTRHMELDFSQISRIFIAGGFGTSIDIENAIKIGLLPDVARSKFIFIGNSSLAGANLALLSQEALKKAEEIARKITYFELSTDGKYMDEYMAALFFPHTDLNKFPSV